MRLRPPGRSDLCRRPQFNRRAAPPAGPRGWRAGWGRSPPGASTPSRIAATTASGTTSVARTPSEPDGKVRSHRAVQTTPAPKPTAVRSRTPLITRPTICHGRAPSADADSDLVPVLAHAVGRDRVKTDGRQEHGDQCQEREQPSRDASVPVEVAPDLRHRARPEDRQVSIQRLDLLAKRGDDGGRVQSAVDHQRDVTWSAGAEGHVDDRARLASPMTYRRRHADDREPLRVSAGIGRGVRERCVGQPPGRLPETSPRTAR